MQEEAPDAEYCPAEHAVHALKDGFGTDPAAQVLQAEAPAAENVLVPQAVQKAAPAAELNVPAAQFKQAAKPTVEYVPATQFEQVREPVVLTNVPAAQSVQATAAVAAMYFPVGHDVQVATPTDSVLLYFPATQSTQVADADVEVLPEVQEVQDVAPPAE